MDGAEAGVIYGGPLGMSRRYHLQKAETKLREDGQREGRCRRKDGVRMGDNVVATKAGVDLGWVLDCLQIVGDGDDGKKREDEHRQGDPLGSPVFARLRRKADPEAEDHDGRKRPSEIEG